MAFIEMSVEIRPKQRSVSAKTAEDDIVDLVYCTRVIAKSGIDITGAIDEPFVYRNEWHYITRASVHVHVREC